MTDSSYLSRASRQKQFPKAGVFIPKYRVLTAGNDGLAYLSSIESGRVFGVSEEDCAGANSGVHYTKPGNPAIFTAGAAITLDDWLRIDGTGSGLVIPWNPTGATFETVVSDAMTGVTLDITGKISEFIQKRNCVGFPLEAAAASGDTFMGWFEPNQF